MIEITEKMKARALEHLQYWTKGAPSEAAIRVACLLEDWQGLHHLDSNEMRKCDWTNPRFVSMRITTINLATYDSASLTWLVFLAHDYCIRVDIGTSPRGVRLLFHPRLRDADSLSLRHPSIEKALADYRQQYPMPDLRVHSCPSWMTRI